MVGGLTLFILFYSLLRLFLKGEQLEWLNILWFTFYSFSEVVPFLTAIALVSFLRTANKNHEVQLLELYDESKAHPLLIIFPLLSFLSGLLILYLFLLKPHFKEEFRSGRLLLMSGSEKAVPLKGGFLWMENGFKWIKNQNDRVLILRSERFDRVGYRDSHQLGHGDIQSLKGDRLVHLEFEDAFWNHLGDPRGVRTMMLGPLLRGGHLFEIFFRMNPLILLWILGFLSWDLGRSKKGGVFLPLSAMFLQYLMLFHIVRPMGVEEGYWVLAFLPSCSMVLWFPWMKRFRR